MPPPPKKTRFFSNLCRIFHFQTFYEFLALVNAEIVSAAVSAPLPVTQSQQKSLSLKPFQPPPAADTISAKLAVPQTIPPPIHPQHPQNLKKFPSQIDFYAQNHTIFPPKKVKNGRYCMDSLTRKIKNLNFMLKITIYYRPKKF